MKNLKIAFCFSGQLRAWEHCREDWFKFINKFDTRPDIFTHFWDFNTNSQRFIPIDSVPKMIHNEEITKYIDIYKPKKYKIDNYETLNKINQFFINTREQQKRFGNNINTYNIWMMPQFYSIYRSTLLKKEYELENKFQYDVCFRLRNDVILSETSMDKILNLDLSNLSGKQTIYVIHAQTLVDKKPRIGDMFFFGNSTVFDIVSNFYTRLPTINLDDDNLPPEYYFAYYIKSLHIPYIDANLEMKVVRDNRHKELLNIYKLEPYLIDKLID